jgi:hypothetical protein
MKLKLSRRQTMQMLTSLPFFHFSPKAVAFSHRTEQSEAVVLVTLNSPTSQAFAHKASSMLDSVQLVVDINQIDTFSSLNSLPKNILLIGLISEAEKILVDTFVQNRRGYLKTSGYLHEGNYTASKLDELLDASIQHAMGTSKASHTEVLGAGNLSSFFAYI